MVLSSILAAKYRGLAEGERGVRHLRMPPTKNVACSVITNHIFSPGRRIIHQTRGSWFPPTARKKSIAFFLADRSKTSQSWNGDEGYEGDARRLQRLQRLERWHVRNCRNRRSRCATSNIGQDNSSFRVRGLPLVADIVIIQQLAGFNIKVFG